MSGRKKTELAQGWEGPPSIGKKKKHRIDHASGYTSDEDKGHPKNYPPEVAEERCHTEAEGSVWLRAQDDMTKGCDEAIKEGQMKLERDRRGCQPEKLHEQIAPDRSGGGQSDSTKLV